MIGPCRATAVLAAFGLVAGLALAGCGGSGGGAVVLTVTPSASLLDETASIRVSGLPKEAEATLAVDAVDADGRAWHSTAILPADDRGAIDTATAAASPGGSYSGVFADGLIAMLRPTDGAAPASFTFPAAGPADFRFSVAVQGQQVATAVQRRSLADANVRSTTLRTPLLFCATSATVAVVVLPDPERDTIWTTPPRVALVAPLLVSG